MNPNLEHARLHLRSGHYLPPRSVAATERVLVVVRDLDDDAVADLAETVADLQLIRSNFRPIFLVGQVDTLPLSRFGFQFETAMDADMLVAAGHRSSPDDHWRARVEEMLAVYGPHRTVHIGPQRPVESWMFP